MKIVISEDLCIKLVFILSSVVETRIQKSIEESGWRKLENVGWFSFWESPGCCWELGNELWRLRSNCYICQSRVFAILSRVLGLRATQTWQRRRRRLRLKSSPFRVIHYYRWVSTSPWEEGFGSEPVIVRCHFSLNQFKRTLKPLCRSQTLEFFSVKGSFITHQLSY